MFSDETKAKQFEGRLSEKIEQKKKDSEIAAAKAAKGNWIVLAEHKQDRQGNWKIVSVKTAKVDGKEIKADTFYRLQGGEFVEESR